MAYIFLCFGRHLEVDCTLKIKYENKNAAERMRRCCISRKELLKMTTAPKLCSNNRSVKNCSKMLLVDLTLMSDPDKNLRCYAILDEQSSSTLVDIRVAEFFWSEYNSH